MGKRIGKYMVDERTNTIFKHDVASGTFTNLDLGGTLDVTGATTLDSTLLCSGHVTIADAKNIILNTTTGTKIGTATGQKLGFFNATPVNQPDAISDVGTANAANNKTAINAALAALRELGLIAS